MNYNLMNYEMKLSLKSFTFFISTNVRKACSAWKIFEVFNGNVCY